MYQAWVSYDAAADAVHVGKVAHDKILVPVLSPPYSVLTSVSLKCSARSVSLWIKAIKGQKSWIVDVWRLGSDIITPLQSEREKERLKSDDSICSTSEGRVRAYRWRLAVLELCLSQLRIKKNSPPTNATWCLGSPYCPHSASSWLMSCPAVSWPCSLVNTNEYCVTAGHFMPDRVSCLFSRMCSLTPLCHTSPAHPLSFSSLCHTDFKPPSI